MDIIGNHIAKIIDYKTQFVDISYILLKKNQYGEDICCQVNKLFLASQLINRLDCYVLDDNDDHVYDYLNCISNSDLPKLYEVLDNLLK